MEKAHAQRSCIVLVHIKVGAVQFIERGEKTPKTPKISAREGGIRALVMGF